MATKTYFKLSPSQSGRSMVEIIGVLAIVGVLSIGGIMGYSYAMDKYRANTTVNDIMLRATDLLAQANQGHTELSLTEWEKEDTIYPIGNADYATDGSVVLDTGTEVNPIPKRVCEMIFDAVIPHTVQIDTNAVRGVSNAACGDNNVMTFYFDPTGAGPTECEPACEEGTVCDNGVCFKTDKIEWFPAYMGTTCTTDEDCQVGYTGIFCSTCKNGVCKNNNYKEGEGCTFDDGTIGQCAQGICQPKSGCNENNPCTGKYEYCASTNSSHVVRFKEGEIGVCVKADVKQYQIDGRVYYVSPGVSWWDARAICDVLGLDFVPKNELYEVKNGKWQRTALTKKLATLCGNCINMWNETEAPSVGDLLGVSGDVDTAYYKNNRGGAGGAAAICR